MKEEQVYTADQQKLVFKGKIKEIEALIKFLEARKDYYLSKIEDIDELI